MKGLLALAFSVLLSACVTTPRQFEDHHVILLEGQVWVKDSEKYTADEINAIAHEYTVPILDEAEKRACKRVWIGQGADLITTAIGLSLGCSEANPLFGGNVLAVVAVKGYLVLACEHQAAQTPAAFSMSTYHNWNAAVGGAAATWNFTRIINGCH